MCCYYVFCNYDDIRTKYGLNKSYRGLELRLTRVLAIHRQPRPHIPLNVYVHRRNLLVQSIQDEVITLDIKVKIRKRIRNIYDITTTTPSWF